MDCFAIYSSLLCMRGVSLLTTYQFLRSSLQVVCSKSVNYIARRHFSFCYIRCKNYSLSFCYCVLAAMSLRLARSDASLPSRRDSCSDSRSIMSCSFTSNDCNLRSFQTALAVFKIVRWNNSVSSLVRAVAILWRFYLTDFVLTDCTNQ